MPFQTTDLIEFVAGGVPATGDIVDITANTSVSYDVVSSSPIDTVEIKSGGHLVFRTDINTTLTVTNLLVLEGGERRYDVL